MQKNTKSIIVAVISVVLVAALCLGAWALYDNFKPTPEAPSSSDTSSTGEEIGAKAVTIKVRNTVTGEEEKVFNYNTDQDYLVGVLTENNLASGTVGQYGLMIETVNGVTADSSQNQFWAIYVNGEYGMYGADTQPVNDGDTFELVLETF